MIINVNKCSQKRMSIDSKNNNNNNNNSTILEHYLNLSIKNKKSCVKISDDDFIIPIFKYYSNIIKYNYNISQLKRIAKNYKLNNSGNKEHLRKRLYNFLYYTYNIKSYITAFLNAPCYRYYLICNFLLYVLIVKCYNYILLCYYNI